MKDYILHASSAWPSKSISFWSFAIIVSLILARLLVFIGAEHFLCDFYISLSSITLFLYVKFLSSVLGSKDFLKIDLHGLSCRLDDDIVVWDWTQISFLELYEENRVSFYINIYTSEPYYGKNLKRGTRIVLAKRISLKAFEGSFLPLNLKKSIETLSNRKDILRCNLSPGRLYVPF